MLVGLNGTMSGPTSCLIIIFLTVPSAPPPTPGATP